MFKIIFVLTIAFVICNGKSLDRQVSCSTTPFNALQCIGNPVIIDRSFSSKCTAYTINQCDFMTCTFREAGWMESTKDGEKVNKQKIKEYFDQYAKDHATWNQAVEALKSSCLNQELLSQGAYLNCPAFDVTHCMFTAFMKNAGSQWSQSKDCQTSKAQIDACPVCPSECFAPAIPIGSCNACYAQPPPKTT